MQLSFRLKEQLFHELAQLAQGGFSFLGALEVMGRNPASRLGRAARQIQANWQSSISGALISSGFPSRDAYVVEVGEKSGRLEEVFRELSVHYAELDAARRMLVMRSAYPVVVFHASVILLSIPSAIMAGNWAHYLATVIPTLAALYLVVGGIWLAWKPLRRALASTPSAAAAFQGIPFLGRGFLTWSAWSYASIASISIRAGGGFLEAFSAAGQACGNAILASASERAIHRVASGTAHLGEAFASERGFPEELVRAIETGEAAGKLDEELSRASIRFQKSAFDQLNLISSWTPRVFYAFVVVFVGWQIIQMANELGGSFGAVLEN
ncbi:MAG: hypothetical protein BGO12_14250 [Verrucomicrobia bacterium 61-8]|nr:type II secretion system F family protein [Verrucomicrobiota bacterium]OJV01372.1 MAG: hypothetical protein BGO12_14250 [Verrucomicrobia bacterium 61-8]